VTGTSDLIRNELNGATVADAPRIWFTTSTSAGDELYSELESVTTPYAEIVYPFSELPLVPAIYDRISNNINRMSGIISDEPQDGSEISSTIGPSAVDAISYSGLTSSTREPPPAPGLYDELTKPDYYNIRPTNAADAAASGTVYDLDVSSDLGVSSNIILSPTSTSTAPAAAAYSGLSSSTRDPPPAPGVYDKLSKPDYYNIMPD